jgi:hypothetical protein
MTFTHEWDLESVESITPETSREEFIPTGRSEARLSSLSNHRSTRDEIGSSGTWSKIESVVSR